MDYGNFSSTLFSGIWRALKEEIDRYTAMVLGEFAVRLTLAINIERGSSSGAVALTDWGPLITWRQDESLDCSSTTSLTTPKEELRVLAL